MNCPNDRFRFDLALAEDAAQIAEVLEEQAFSGDISLLYTRRPDAYYSFQNEGDQVWILVCRDQHCQKIIGIGALAARSLYVNGKPERIGYLFGLRSLRRYRCKFSILKQGYAFLREVQRQNDIAWSLTTILQENIYAQKMLEKKRPYMPSYCRLGSYSVYALLGKPEKSTWQRLDCRKAESADIPELVAFLNRQGQKLQFFPVVDEQLFQGQLPGLEIDRVVVMRQHREIVAVGALWDQRGYKQYQVIGYGGAWRWLYPFSSLLPLFGYPKLAKPGKILNFFTLSWWAVKNSDPQIFSCFLDAVAHFGSSYDYFVVGLSDSNSLQSIISARRHIRYRSTVYGVYWGNPPYPLDDSSPGYLECAML